MGVWMNLPLIKIIKLAFCCFEIAIMKSKLIVSFKTFCLNSINKFYPCMFGSLWPNQDSFKTDVFIIRNVDCETFWLGIHVRISIIFWKFVNSNCTYYNSSCSESEPRRQVRNVTGASYTMRGCRTPLTSHIHFTYKFFICLIKY